MIVDAMQSFFKSAGEESCYASCIIKIASRITRTELTLRNIAKAMEAGIDAGYIDFNTKDYSDKNRNFYVVEPAKYLGLLTGKRFTCNKVSSSYTCKPGEYEVLWKVLSQDNARKNIGHFVLPDWDPIQNSNTGKNGFTWTKRIFREVK